MANDSARIEPSARLGRIYPIRFTEKGKRQMQVFSAAKIALPRMAFEPCNRSAEHILAWFIETDCHKKPHVSHSSFLRQGAITFAAGSLLHPKEKAARPLF